MELALRGLVSAHAGTGAAWLLLRREEETLVQWTSAEGGLAARLLRAVRKLAERAFRSGQATTELKERVGNAQALYLPRREQVVVTWLPESSPPGA